MTKKKAVVLALTPLLTASVLSLAVKGKYMKKELSLLLVGLATGALLNHWYFSSSDSSPLPEQLVFSPAALADSSKVQEKRRQPDPSQKQPITEVGPEKAATATVADGSTITEFVQADAFKANALQLAKIENNIQWMNSFHGNYSEEANAATQSLIRIVDALVTEYGFYHDNGCNQNFCALLAQGFTDQQQAEDVLQKLLTSDKIPNFKYHKITNDHNGIALRLSVPIDRDYVPSADDVMAFAN